MSRSEKPPHIITDIVLEIFGHLRHSPRALRQCSLVCKQWVYPSQELVFRTIRVLNNTLTRDFQHLIRFLTDHQILSSFVKHLVLLKEKGEVGKRCLDLQQLHEIISRLPKLTSLQLCDLDLRACAEGIQKAFQVPHNVPRGPIPQIRTLLLDRISVAPVDFTYFLRLVSSVETLHITDSESTMRKPPCHSPLPVNLANLRCIKLNCSPLGSGLIQRLSETHPSSRFHSLSIVEHDPITPDVFRNPTFSSSSTLRRLCLYLKNVASDRDRNQSE